MPELQNSIANCVLFDKIDKQIVTQILSSAERNHYKTGDVLIEKGTVPRALFIVEKGTVGIYNEDVLLVRLGELSILGESFIANAVATATITAATDLTMVEIKTDHFYQLAQKYPELIFNLFAINHQRLRNSNEQALKEAHDREEKLAQLVKERTAELIVTLENLKKSNNELEETRDSLIETQKFRQQFLANMSHEIRTPMNAIVGLTNLLLKGKLDAQQDKYLNVIKKSGANLLVIINDILDLAKIESGKMELEATPFPLKASIAGIQTILSLKAQEKGIHMKERIAPDVPEWVLGDETRITQVIMNLAGNAVKFTTKGSVTIDVSLESRTESHCRVKFSIKDTGIGIPEDKIDTIFESFGQASSDTTRKFGGTGLGLTISKQLVEMHGGELLVKSKVGEGSDFYFVIDYIETDKPAEESMDDGSSTHSLQGKKILLVEDNEFNQLVAVDTINDLFPEVTVEVAENGLVALEKLAASDYAFIFMDIQMPEMDGYETARQIRKRFTGEKGNIRICAMTANVTKEEIEACATAGMNDYMMKPFTQEDLKEKILKNAFINA
jgi:signal transduction histidine kinase/CheY-like chemotaxis protein